MTDTIIKNYRSSTPGHAPASLEAGQLAINDADHILFYRASNGAVKQAALKSPAELQILVDDAISDLIGGAPGALDTLNELAAAIGDNANYAATITQALAGKAASSHTHDDRYVRAIVSTGDPDGAQGVDGQLWLKREA